MGRIETVLPRKALIFFEDDYIEERDIVNGVMGAAKPLSTSSARKLGSALTQANFISVSGIIPENLLFCNSSPGQEKFVWFKPASLQHLYFHENLKIKDGIFPLPPLVFIGSKGSLEVFALQENSKPKTDTILCLAPFHNVNSNGDVCLGNSRGMSKPKTFEDFISYFEILFFNSRFTHANNSQLRTNINSLWRGLKGKKEFPLDKLVATKATLKDLLK
jgi:PRTRC genetic system protein B